MKGWRSLSGGFFISSEDAQVLSLGSLPGLGQDPADSTALRLCSYSNVFCSPEQKLHCYTEHFMNLKSFIWNWSLNDFFYLPGLLAIPFKYPNENEEGLCCLSHFQVSMNYTSTRSQRARSWFSYWAFGLWKVVLSAEGWVQRGLGHMLTRRTAKVTIGHWFFFTLWPRELLEGGHLHFLGLR